MTYNPLVQALRTIVLLAVLVCQLGVSAQTGGSGDPGASGEVRIEVDRFGVGGSVRAGGYAGVRLALTDLGSRVRPVLVRIHTTDPDGDTVYNERAVTLNPGATQGVWLYPFLPFTFDDQSQLIVTVHEIGSDNAPEQLPDPGRQIAISRISPTRYIESEDAMVGVIGRSKLGLEQYEAKHPGMRMHPTGFEWQRIIPIDAGQLGARLPDRVMGLDPFDVIVWNEGEPASIRLESAEAIRQWVHAGGHLVVVLPAVGGSWLNESSNPLHDLLPTVTVTRRERVDLDRYRALLTSSERLSLPSETVVHTMTLDAGAGQRAGASTSIVLAGLDGEGVVARRIIGAGAVTLIGFDLGERVLAQRLDAQRFWHRILGHRFDVLSLTEITDLENRRERRAYFERFTSARVDTDFAGVVDRTGRAGVGVMIGLVLCVAYLLIAGPLGFGFLKSRGWQRYSWSAFLGSALVFTLVAWVSSTQARPKSVSVESIVVLDAVYGQPVQRARAWLNVLLPTYGTQTISMDDADSTETMQATISAWDAKPTTALGVQNRFPDARGYRVDTRAHSALNVPTRSTVKMFQADWIGATSLGFPIPEGGSLEVDVDGTLRGSLVHQLPGALDHVIVAYVSGQLPLRAQELGSPLQSGVRFFSRTSDWEAGEAFEFEWEASTPEGQREVYLDNLASGARRHVDSLSASDLHKRIEMLTWYPMLKQPDYFRSRSSSFTSVTIERHATHGLDLGRWFTQPCLIVFGELRDVELPVPLRVDGRRVGSSSRVFVRWVYPLPSRPPAFAGAEAM
ncbi:MAG: hypothetical protein ACF8GE_06675 [Phycisphaerales bacterium JB043]